MSPKSSGLLNGWDAIEFPSLKGCHGSAQYWFQILKIPGSANRLECNRLEHLILIMMLQQINYTFSPFSGFTRKTRHYNLYWNRARQTPPTKEMNNQHIQTVPSKDFFLLKYDFIRNKHNIKISDKWMTMLSTFRSRRTVLVNTQVDHSWVP